MIEDIDEVNQNNNDSKDIADINDRSKIVGRDGAYLEIDVKDLVSAYRSGDLDKAEIVVLKSVRIELSDPLVVAGLKEHTRETISSNECEGMTDEQISFYIALRALVSGLKK